jgi:site-specific DNA-methyltransferase (adenine-specific)
MDETMNITPNTIYNEDNLATLARMADESIDLVVTSPPYDNLRTYNGFSWDFGKLSHELFRVVKKGGVAVWIVGDAVINGSESGTSFRQALGFMDAGFRLHDTMIYQKMGVRHPHPNRYHDAFEYMFVMSKGAPKTVNLITDVKNITAGRTRIKTLRDESGEFETARRQAKRTGELSVRQNVWLYSMGFNNAYDEEYLKSHPAVMPEKLAHDHIVSWSNEGDIVYDPFMGSGTVAKMALLADRRFVGSEISGEYCDLANRRIQAVLAQPRLF